VIELIELRRITARFTALAGCLSLTVHKGCLLPGLLGPNGSRARPTPPCGIVCTCCPPTAAASGWAGSDLPWPSQGRAVNWLGYLWPRRWADRPRSSRVGQELTLELQGRCTTLPNAKAPCRRGPWNSAAASDSHGRTGWIGACRQLLRRKLRSRLDLASAYFTIPACAGAR